MTTFTPSGRLVAMFAWLDAADVAVSHLTSVVAVVADRLDGELTLEPLVVAPVGASDVVEGLVTARSFANARLALWSVTEAPWAPIADAERLQDAIADMKTEVLARGRAAEAIRRITTKGIPDVA